MRDFYSWLRESRSLLCVGIDPDPTKGQLDLWWLEKYVQDTAPWAAVFKPNFGFFAQAGVGGLQALLYIIKYIHKTGKPVILDIKAGDIGYTAEAYAKMVYDAWEADAVTLSPYLGVDSIRPFLRPNKGVYILCHTSNPSSPQLQERVTLDGRPLYEAVVEICQQLDQPVGYVVGATYPGVLPVVRRLAPNGFILAPGVGKQGGSAEEAILGGINRETWDGIVVNASGSIMNAPNPGEAAKKLFDELKAAQQKAREQPVVEHDPYEDLIVALYKVGCVKFGNFTLVSGKQSPIYIDLRVLPSYPDVLRQTCRVYAGLLSGLGFRRIAPIPYAAMPIGTLVGQMGNWPMIYVREDKGHGTGNKIEGHFDRGDSVVVLDDLITTAKSKLGVIDPLREAGLEVKDVVVLIDREQGGGEQLETAGCQLHSAFTLRHAIHTYARLEMIAAEQLETVEKYLDGERQ